MAPRRGGAAGAGVDAAVAFERNCFEPPPLRRRQPWLQDGAGQCDVLAGGVDHTGVFKGVYIGGAHLVALLRTFQLSKVFMPCELPTPVVALGQSLQDGIPLIIVTRGCFGRELDYGPGPARNDIQSTIWHMARDMRSEMPQILITCIDVPLNLGSDMLDACLKPPLNEYQELMYHEGTWYAPVVLNAAPLGKFERENKRLPMKTQSNSKSTVVLNRKRFDWNDPTRLFSNLWCISWKAVLEVRPLPEVLRRKDLDFTGIREQPQTQPVPSQPSAAESTFRKVLAQAKDASSPDGIVASVKAYVARASAKEADGLREAARACDEAMKLFTAQSQPQGALEATAAKVSALTAMGSFDEALTAARRGMEAAETAKNKLESLKVVCGCHRALGELVGAVEAADAGRKEIAQLGDEDDLCEAWQILVEAHIARGDTEEAIVAVKEAMQAGGKVEACGNVLLAEVLKVKGSTATADPKSAAKEAFAAQKRASDLYGSLGCLREQREALVAATHALLSCEEFADALALAKEIKEMGIGAPSPEEKCTCEASGLEMMARAHLSAYLATNKYLEEGDTVMLPSIRSALALFEESKDAAGKARALRLLAEVLVTISNETGNNSLCEEAQRLAKQAAVAFKELGRGPAELSSALLLSATASMRTGNLLVAYWDAKQAMVEAGESVPRCYNEAAAIASQVKTMAEESGKPINVGAPVPVYMGDKPVTFV